MPDMDPLGPPLCPSWCNVDHQVSFWSDELHLSEVLTVPGLVLEKDRADDGSLHRRPADRTLNVCLYQHPEDQQPWISFGTEEELGMELSLETAERFAEALAKLINRAR
ncbi:hypothetical protein [Brevibacterium sp.]|uniref:hypothetical protein n=1 Tax=Brevibacterium sp. TaxID=1701 RepID=UPI0028122FA8|nr:hypothetical protein [Brevibacterium sp.]